MDRDENENLLCEYDLSSDDEKRKGSSVSSEEATTEKFRQHDYNNFEPSHPWISIFIAFLAFAVDAMLFTVVDPILPDMLRQIDLQPDRWVSNAWLTQAEPLVHSNETEALQTKNSVKIAVMIGMKPLLEMAFNICIGFLIERIGYRAPMLVGAAFNMGATLSFAYLRNYYLLIIARAMQALAGSLSVVGALSFLAATFREDKARMRATSIAFTGLSVGLTGGYVMGSFLYQFCATECPYLIIAGICLVDSTFRILFVTSKPSSEGKKVKASLSDSAISLLKDPLVLAGLAINFIQKVCLGVYLSTGPSWILYSLHGEQWNLGVLFGCGTLVMLTSQLATSRLAQVHTMWKPVFLSLLLLSAGVAMYPLCTSPWQVLVPDLTGRVGHGILVAALNPMLHHIVDMRHNSSYGILNGFYTATLNLGLGFGPNAAGVLLKVIPFKWLYWGLASIVLGMSSLALYWRNLDSHKQSTTQSKLV